MKRRWRINAMRNPNEVDPGADGNPPLGLLLFTISLHLVKTRNMEILPRIMFSNIGFAYSEFRSMANSLTIMNISLE